MADNPFNAIINLVTATLIIALIYTFALSGGALAITFSKLPNIFWIAVILIILYWLIGRK